MGTKVSIAKGVSAVLVVSMIGLGAAPSIPSVFADELSTTVTSTGQNTSNSLEINLSSLEKDGYSVKNSINSITLDGVDPNAKITVTDNNTSYTDISQGIPLQTGDNNYVISVSDGTTPDNTQTYNFTVTREKSSNDSLQDIKLSAGQLKFDPAADPVTPYNVQVENNVDSLTITPVLADTTATVKVDPSTATDQGFTVQVPPVGKTTEITITVTAENGKDQKTYKLEVTRADQTPGSQTSGTGSTQTSGTGSTQTSGAGSTQTSGTGNSHPGGSSMSNSKPGSTGLNGTHSMTGARNTSTANHKNAGTFDKSNAGATSEQQNSQQFGGVVQKPSTATLSFLSVTAGTWNKTFASDTFTYHVALPNDVDSVTISATPAYSGAAVVIADGTTRTISIGDQKKTIVSVVITNGTDKKTYVLVFDKAEPDPVTTTAAGQQVSSTTENLSTDSITKSSNASTSTNKWNAGQNNAPTSFWSRLVDSIRSFFSKL
ncbi:cadherin-like beta sandwich domain-containing protein [Bacillus sp. EB600]|uniref:cadherin-like beta sandwich domain-containing protein n=1 Tax=Bacillus sp. EB600 TaxID=2806345 RepID=UPI002108E120|nr:cadherin-like beta sandwich domain-containing protein [Bacillus sp. EB600]MCQ6281998.1 cadherin-like beta sandwich domain-containing protein [Bacillus sp. EB600]